MNTRSTPVLVTRPEPVSLYFGKDCGSSSEGSHTEPSPDLFRIGDVIRANLSLAMKFAVAMVRPLPTRAIISLAILRITSAPTLAVCIEHVPVLAFVDNCIAKKNQQRFVFAK
jgi:hypothetical protein